jgi:hypothetical protein
MPPSSVATVEPLIDERTASGIISQMCADRQWHGRPDRPAEQISAFDLA